MKKNDDVLKTYIDGPNLQDKTQQDNPKKRSSSSKLQPYSEYIFKLCSEDRSYQFIANRLKTMGLECDRSTVFRFYKKIISL